MIEDSRQASDTTEIPITPEMIEAGTLEVMQFNSREDSVENAEEIAKAAYLAMWNASPCNQDAAKARHVGDGFRV
jgi:endonuclease YncB( thermonuclease family)